MGVKIVNEDILDEKEPIIYVQRYFYPHRAYQVFRKPTSNDEPFVISEDAEQCLWCVSSLLNDPEPYNSEEFDDLPKIFAMIYLDEENPPVDDPEDCPGAEPYINVVYDPETQLYGCEATFIEYEEVETIFAPTLQEVIEQAIAMLDEFFEKKAIKP